MKTDEWDIGYDPHTYLDSEAFRAYRRQIVAIVEAAGCPVTIREIHNRLGDAAKPDWTMDALDGARELEPVGILPTRYRFRPVAKRRSRRTTWNGNPKTEEQKNG